jgi:hypothetical protein
MGTKAMWDLPRVGSGDYDPGKREHQPFFAGLTCSGNTRGLDYHGAQRTLASISCQFFSQVILKPLFLQLGARKKDGVSSVIVLVRLWWQEDGGSTLYCHTA